MFGEFRKRKKVERCIYDLHQGSSRFSVLNIFCMSNVFEREIVSLVASYDLEPLELMIDT